MQRFGKFEIRDLLGEGGFGRVFRAYDPDLKREVAIKTCRLADLTIRRRFLREAEIAAGLRHPNIVVVHELGEEGGEPFMVQEYLPGEDIESLIARQVPVPVQRKVRWLRAIADALAFAHEHGVIHRDVKPQNVRVLPDDSIRVLDFGIAKRSIDRASTALTQTGFSIGTLGYIAPEQLMGAAYDHRADIFSFGALAYRLMTYAEPFDGDTAATVFYKIANVHPVWPAHIAGECAPELLACIDQCLAKRPEDRYQSCRAVIHVLDNVLAGSTGLTAGAQAPVRDEPGAPRKQGQSPDHERSARLAIRRVLPAVAGTLVLIALGTWARSTRGRTPHDVPAAGPDTLMSIPGLPPPETAAHNRLISEAGPDSMPEQISVTAPPATGNSRPASSQLSGALVAVFVDTGPTSAQLAAARSAAQDMLVEQLDAAGLRDVTNAVETTTDASLLASARRLRRQIAVICRIAVTDVVESNEFGMSSVTASVSLVAIAASSSAEVSRASNVATGAGTSVGAATVAAVRRAMSGMDPTLARDLNAWRDRVR
jgi:serine/threonine-protein kinase